MSSLRLVAPNGGTCRSNNYILPGIDGVPKGRKLTTEHKLISFWKAKAAVRTINDDVNAVDHDVFNAHLPHTSGHATGTLPVTH